MAFLLSCQLARVDDHPMTCSGLYTVGSVSTLSPRAVIDAYVDITSTTGVKDYSISSRAKNTQSASSIYHALPNGETR